MENKQELKKLAKEAQESVNVYFEELDKMCNSRAEAKQELDVDAVAEHFNSIKYFVKKYNQCGCTENLVCGFCAINEACRQGLNEIEKLKKFKAPSVEVGEKELEDISYHDIDGHCCYVDTNAAKAIIQLLKDKGVIK